MNYIGNILKLKLKGGAIYMFNHNEYRKTLKRYVLQLNPRNDIDQKIIEHLGNIKNKNEYIKNLIIKDGGIK